MDYKCHKKNLKRKTPLWNILNISILRYFVMSVPGGNLTIDVFAWFLWEVSGCVCACAVTMALNMKSNFNNFRHKGLWSGFAVNSLKQKKSKSLFSHTIFSDILVNKIVLKSWSQQMLDSKFNAMQLYNAVALSYSRDPAWLINIIPVVLAWKLKVLELRAECAGKELRELDKLKTLFFWSRNEL